MKIAVIIPARNEAHHLSQLFRAFDRQTLAKDEFQVVLVDNGSTDRTAEDARRLLHIYGLRGKVVSIPHAESVSAVRNEGVAHSEASVYAFLDADCIPHSEWLETALRCDYHDGIWGADYALPRNATWVGRAWSSERVGEVAWLPGGCLLVPAPVFRNVGGFNPDLKTAEDVDFCARARRQGWRVRAFPELAVTHLGTPSTLRGFYRQNRWHGKHVLRMFLNNLPSMKHAPLLGLTAYTFLMVWASVICLFLAAFHPSRWLVLPLALLLLPPVALGVRKASRSSLIPGLCVLYFLYLLARAEALL